MRYITQTLQNNRAAAPCLFYPAVRESGAAIADALTHAALQAEILKGIAQEYSAGMVIRVTELWCEAASFGMDCSFSDEGFPALGEAVFEDAEQLADARMPDAINKVTEPLIEAARKAAPMMDKPLVVGITGPYTLGSVLNGSEDFMVNCMTEEELVEAFLDRLTIFLIDYVAEYKRAGAAAVMIAEPSIAMISPAMAERFSCHYIAKIIESVQDERFSVIYHNCGAVNAHLDVLAKLNADGFHFGSDVDLARALALIDNDRLVMGNIDPQLFLRGDEGIVLEKAAALNREYGARENWLLSTGCDLAPMARRASIDALWRTE